MLIICRKSANFYSLFGLFCGGGLNEVSVNWLRFYLSIKKEKISKAMLIVSRNNVLTQHCHIVIRTSALQQLAILLLGIFDLSFLMFNAGFAVH